MNDVIAIIQCTAKDFGTSLSPDDYCVSVLKSNTEINHIILAMPQKDKNDSRVIEIAISWNIPVYFGDDWDVLNRIILSVKEINPLVIVRVLLRNFYLDSEMLSEIIGIVKSGYDYVLLGNDINYALYSDVFSYKALLRVRDALQGRDDFYSNACRFAPWSYMTKENGFSVFLMEQTKMWDEPKVEHVKEKLKGLIGADQNLNHVEIINPASRYKNVLQYISSTDIVCDIACGQGLGLYEIALKSAMAVGIDNNQIYIQNAKTKYVRDNLSYFYGTDEILKKFDNHFDTIVSLHTLEHVQDDNLFLERIFKSLKPEGVLLLEVPRLFRYPLGEPLFYFHLREYNQNGLEKMLKEVGFHIIKKYGCNRHVYADIKEARDGFFYICSKGDVNENIY